MNCKKLVSTLLILCLLCALLPGFAVAEPETKNAPQLPEYNIAAAVAYAKAHWNDGYGQCAQFVSICLRYGGIEVPNSWKYYSMNEPRYWGSRMGPYTNPYICSGALLKWLSTQYEVVTEPEIYDMEIGDVILMRADGNPDGHAGIITGFAGDMPLYTAHNRDCLDELVNHLARFLVKLAPRTPAICDRTENCAGKVFKDMPKPNHWSHDPIDYVFENGLFLGTSDTTFSPRASMTRAMLVTVLWRYNGDTEKYAQPFLDVAENSWYNEPIAWAASHGIVNGMSPGKFRPDEPVTREQVATIFLRYEALFGEDSGTRADFSQFADGAAVSAWATDAMQWAVAEGIVTGSSDKSGLWLYPKNQATRAEVAALLSRFVD